MCENFNFCILIYLNILHSNIQCNDTAVDICIIILLYYIIRVIRPNEFTRYQSLHLHQKYIIPFIPSKNILLMKFTPNQLV